MTTFLKHFFTIITTTLLLILYGFLPTPALALDTDIYAINPRPNVAIQFDTSGSMGFGIYDSSVNYKSIYTAACEQTDGGYIAYDRDNTKDDGGGVNNLYYKMFISHEGDDFIDLDPAEIVLIKGTTGVTITKDAEGNDISQTGDAGYPAIKWDFANLKKTFTKLVDGEIVPFTEETPRLSVNGEEQTIWLDGAPLPLDRGITLNNIQVYEDNTTIDLGFAGRLQAPGFHFSGYGSSYAGVLDEGIAADDDAEAYFLASANWVYMMLAYQLYDRADAGYSGYYDDKPYSVLANKTIPSEVTWSNKTLGTAIISPNYSADYDGIKQTIKCGEIIQLDAVKIKLHFTDLELSSADTKDTIIIRNKETGDEIGEITNSSNSTVSFDSAEFVIEGTYSRGLVIYLETDGKTTVGKGFKIDGYSYSTNSSEYTMKPRLDAVRDAILFVVDDTRGQINWALSGFDNTDYGDGADIKQPFNPEHANDDAVRENIIVQLNKFEADGGTPLGEAMQDIFNHFHKKDKDFSECSRQFCILISDGYPSMDTEWDRMDTGVTIDDKDEDGWTSDPSQGSVVDNYLDDVTKYMYTHVFRDPGLGDPFGAIIDDPENSFDNITTHTLSFAQDLPLLVNAAEDGGGISLAANNGQQMINALRSLAMLAIKSASYVAPVISVDTANKMQSGEWLYMAFFKPTSDRWVGNLKKYRLAKKIKAGSCPGREEKEEWVVSDSINYTAGMDDLDANDAVDCDGQFLTDSISFWSEKIDGGEVTKGGVGKLLQDRVKETFDNTTYYTGRNIYVLSNEGSLVPFNYGSLNTAGLLDQLADNELGRYQIINYIYGYTFDADETNGFAPKSYRYWPLGSFIHSNPNIIDYEDEEKTYIAIGSNDGMIHVFNDSDGSEVIALIPEDLLVRLKELNPDKEDPDFKESPLFFIDGQTTYYREFSDTGKSLPKQLIFGFRRGGSSYYSINVEDSTPSDWKLKWHIKGGTDDFDLMGESWSKIELMRIRKSEDTETVAGVFGGGYDLLYDDEATIKNETEKPGCALYIIDIPESNTTDGVKLLGKTVYKNAEGTLINTEMKYAIPANPSVIPDKYGYLETIYFADLGGQIWNFDYDNNSYKFDTNPRIVFKSNPGSNASSGVKGSGTIDNSDTGRRMFYSPTVTLMGKCDYRHSEVSGCDYTDFANEACKWKTWDAYTYTLVVGTGDRVHPNRKDINNRIYMILDTNKSDPLDETNLFNVTMDETDIDSNQDQYNNTGDDEKKLKQDYLSTTNGWYIKLEDIDDIDDYGEPVYHDGEKIIARPTIFNGVAYVPSFAPITEDECYPKGQAKIYALNYCDGTAAVNFFKANDDTGGDDPKDRFDYRDRYKTIGESIPSSPKIIIRDGKPEIFISVGGGLPTIEPGKLPYPVEVINWREMRNQ